MKQVFEGTNIEYKVLDNQIVLTAKETKVAQQKAQTIKGTVVDKSGEPLIGVSIVEKGTTNGTVTDLDRKLYADASNSQSDINIFICRLSEKELPVIGSVLNVTLEDDSQVLNEVVVTALGIKKEAKALSYNVQGGICQ